MKYNRYPKRDAIKNYFSLPNEIFMLGLDTGELAVYSYLRYRENRKSFQCYPSYKTIGKAIGKSKNSVRKYVLALEDRGLIRTEPTSTYTKAGEKRNGNLLYTIRPIQEAIGLFHERQMIQAEAELEKQRAMRRLEKFDRVTAQKPLRGALASPESPSPCEDSFSEIEALSGEERRTIGAAG